MQTETRRLRFYTTYWVAKTDSKNVLGEVAPRPGFGPGSCGRQPHILDRTILPGQLCAATIHGNELIKLFSHSTPIYLDKPPITIHFLCTLPF